jgi:hypothetical protein
MKRLETKKSQFDKAALSQREKRNLKFAHDPKVSDLSPPNLDAIVTAPLVVDPVKLEPLSQFEVPEPQSEVISDSVTESVIIPEPVREPKAKISLLDRVVSIALPIAALGLLGTVVAALAKFSGYDAAFILSRLN